MAAKKPAIPAERKETKATTAKGTKVTGPKEVVDKVKGTPPKE